eukprot:CAMPEP_0168731320 /NCGR_PEP_ID=MMETSP0724-20121128/7190_1 /TAXON_ID=265536 /ORGANISM="Amphiprora sp., Strain CCMP467" /LENGTH=920 /DNA_ID=CAMNT_0008778295 /DNA_START=226 /DNA_END=2988 /DNA_ORIENTATION=+
MPRNKILLKGRGAPSKNGNKIVIRPYQKPPTLPPNYYETTVQDLLRVTMAVLDTTLTKTTTAQSSTGTSTKTSSGMSLQNAYNAVVNLVSHQYGPRLYQDLKQSMQQACEKVLTSSQDWSTNGDKIPALYQSYTEYLLCVKHVFLPLDRTHVWRQQQTGAAAASANNPASSDTSSAVATPQQSIWQVGLTVWAERLTEMGLDKALYQSWLEILLQEWNPTGTTSVANLSGFGNENILRMTISATANTTSWLQSVWYMWQDLGWSGAMSVNGGTSTGVSATGASNSLDIMSQLQQDLEGYWKTESQKWASEIPYRVVPFVHYCHEKHSLILQKWPWLPSVWLQSLVEHFLFLPHLMQIPQRQDGDDVEMANNNITATTKKKNPPPGLLLQPANFNPILEEAMSSQNVSIDRNNTAISQLWMLAGRIPLGQVAVAQSIAQFARTQGLLRVHVGAAAPAASTNNISSKKAAEASTLAAVGDLLQLQDSLRQLIRSLPHGTELIKLKSVWEEVVNQDTKPMSVAEALAKFLDQTLRSTKKMDQFQQQYEQPAVSSSAAPASANNATSNSSWLNRIISGIFVPLQAKDVFEAFYKRDLAKRLLLNRVVSMDVEKQVCSLLKAECGAAYTSKMEGMFQDVDWSRETMMVYKQAIGSAPGTNNGVEMDVQVLTTGYWPVYPQFPDLQLPDSLKHHQEQFDTHYKTKYQGRRMTWQYALGHCVVKATGLGKPYELIVGLTQALVLLQLNDASQKWTLPALQKAVGLEDRGEMERILQSLSGGKEGTRILRKLDHDRDVKAPPGEAQPPRKKKTRSNVDDQDEFVVNGSFESNQRRIRIPNLMMKETKDERDKTVEGVARDRLYLIDAVLVRVMKARKTILHQALIPQVLEQVKVPAQPADVKKRIESLIEREYMERDAKDRNRYNYLA